jgi:hypothetical protein
MPELVTVWGGTALSGSRIALAVLGEVFVIAYLTIALRLFGR